MDIDYTFHLGAVQRTVTETELDGKPARRVTLERVYDTSAADLWEALTTPERLQRWFLPISGELQLGGRYQLEGNAGGTITECRPHSFFAATWEFQGGVSWIEVRLTPQEEESTRLTLTHICPVDEFWQQFGPGAVGVGWDLGLLGLVVHLADSDGGRFDEEAFALSPEGKTYITGASQGWGQAAVAAGEDPAKAEAGVKLTTSTYTGETRMGN